MVKLSVNVNKLATIRNARGSNNPDILKSVLEIISYGAQGITVHPRPDERHIRRQDVYDIAREIKVEFNVEGYPDPDFLSLVHVVKPQQCTLVPDSPDVLTSNSGWCMESHFILLKKTIEDLHQHGIRTALFIDPYKLNDSELKLIQLSGTDRVELYTQAYAESYGTKHQDATLQVYSDAAAAMYDIGVEVNAGHDLDLENLRLFVQSIPEIQEVSIGHALICDALHFGMQETITRYLDCCR